MKSGNADAFSAGYNRGVRYVVKKRSFVGLNPSPFNRKRHPVSYGSWKKVGEAASFEEASKIAERNSGMDQVAIFLDGKRVSEEIGGRFCEVKHA